MKLKRGQVEKSLTSDYSRFLRISFARRAKPWEMIADRLSKAGWSWGCVTALNSEGRTIWIVERLATMESGSLCVPMKS
jgi:hypothetical protein